MTHYMKELQTRYNELTEKAVELQNEITSKTAELAELRGKLTGLELAAGTYNELMASGSCNEKVEEEENVKEGE